MLRSLYTAGTGMIAQQHNLDVIANNLANVNTNGFKQQRAEFQDLMYTVTQGQTSTGQGRPEAIQTGMGVKLSATSGNFGQGALQNTDNPLNMAIQGDGFFSLTGPDGSPIYTRDGNFQLDSEGSLVNVDGYYVEPKMTIDPRATSLSVSADGTVRGLIDGVDTQFGKVKLSTFINPAGLSRLGGNNFAATAASGEAQEREASKDGAGRIESGFLEGSNVQVVEEMTRMITAQRAYEINSKAIQTADDMLSIVNQLKR